MIEQLEKIEECHRCGEGEVIGKNIQSYDKFTQFPICLPCLKEVIGEDWEIE